MKKQIKLNGNHGYTHMANTFLLMCLFVIILMLAFFKAGAATTQYHINTPDTALSAAINKQLAEGKLPLKFPLTVKRFYMQRQFKKAWLTREADADRTWAAMLMIDCVLQFGLNQADYHPGELLYSKLHDILERPAQMPLAEKARFEIMLTDAMVTFANNLHFGKYNPQFAAAKIDKGSLPFNAIELIGKALQSEDFMTAVLSAQPQNHLYKNLQNHMHTVAGVQTGDCYEFPEADVRKMALNMERLRWAAMDTDNFIQVNIPSNKLIFNHKGKIDSFSVVAGILGYPTPTLNSAITSFTTSPEWRVPKNTFIKDLLPKAIRNTSYLSNNHYTIYNSAGMRITPGPLYLKMILKAPQRYYATQYADCDNALGQVMFTFANAYGMYMHDAPERGLFFKDNRAYIHGCIQVQHAAALAKLLLADEGRQSMIPTMENDVAKGIKKQFSLKMPMPIAVTYLTCEMVNGVLVIYNDVYDLDKNLDMLMYSKGDQTLKIGQN